MMDDSDSSEVGRHRYIKDKDKKDITCRQAGYVFLGFYALTDA